jgi:hypothetical protein
MYKQYLIDFLEKTSVKAPVNEQFNYDHYIKNNDKVSRIMEMTTIISEKRNCLKKRNCKYFFDFLLNAENNFKKPEYEESFDNDLYKLKIYSRIYKCMKRNREHKCFSIIDIQRIIEDVEFLVKKYRHQYFHTKSRLYRQSTIENCSLDFWFRLKNIKNDIPSDLYNKLKKIILSYNDKSYSLN